LKGNAFDINDSETQNRVSSAIFDDMCKTEWSTQSDYDNSANSVGLGGSYGAVSGYLNVDKADQHTALHTVYDHMCVRKDSDLRSFLFTKSHVQSASGAVAAWRDCELKGTGLYAALSLPPSGNDFQIYVRYRAQNPNDSLVLRGYNKNSGYGCQLSNDEIDDYNLRKHNISGDFSLQCKRTSPEGVNVVINTNTNDPIGPFYVPSAQYILMTRQIRALQDEADRLNHRIDAIDASTFMTPFSGNHPILDGALQQVLVGCPDSSKIVGYVCQVATGYGNLQTAGINSVDNNFRCEWRNTGAWTNGAFAATGAAVCLSLKKP
jgi:hypothetical protein